MNGAAADHQRKRLVTGVLPRPPTCSAMKLLPAHIAVRRTRRACKHRRFRAPCGHLQPSEQPLTRERSEHGGFSCSRRCNEAWISFLARIRPACTAPRADGAACGSAHRASTPPRAHPSAATWPASARGRLRAGGAGHPRVMRRDHHHTVDVRLQQWRNSAAARHLQRHPIRRLQALRQRLDALRRARHSTTERVSTVFADRDLARLRCTSRPIARPTHLGSPNPHLHSSLVMRENRRRRHRPIRARSSIQASRRGGRTKSSGLEHRSKRPTRLRSPNEAPVPDRPNLRPEPDGPHTRSFMPRKAAVGRRHAVECSVQVVRGRNVGGGG